MVSANTSSRAAIAWAELYPGLALDPPLEFALSEHPKDLLRVNTGELVFERLPIFPLLIWPLYKGFGIYGLYLLPALAGASID